jgi:GNAT superfamily N-acetyltransferase
MTNGELLITPPEVGHGHACEQILRELPEWFGLEDSLMEYVEAAKSTPTLLAMEGEKVLGFLMIKRHFPESAEVVCIGLLPSHHRRGIGRLMQGAAENWLLADGCRYLQVKTLAESAHSESYALTRKFYEAMGFSPLEVHPDLWQEWNPCLVLVKALAPESELRQG